MKKILIEQANPGDIILDETNDVYIVNEFEGVNDHIVNIHPRDCLGRKLPICGYTRDTEVTWLGRVPE